jgi:hypothetical protein
MPPSARSKLRVLQSQLHVATYTSESVPALKAVAATLAAEEDEARTTIKQVRPAQLNPNSPSSHPASFRMLRNRVRSRHCTRTDFPRTLRPGRALDGRARECMPPWSFALV